jgi:tRNA/rRNA methyltransferase
LDAWQIFVKNKLKHDFTMSDTSALPSIPVLRSLLNRVRVVMVETSHPGNVGSAARAMKTMGLTDLVLVAPKLADACTHPNAIALASGATDVLERARVVTNLNEAIADTSFAVAFTARRRELSHPIVAMREAVTQALQVAAETTAPIALVFGNEAMCLSNEQVDLCQLAATIPANSEYSSLNVSQSVQVAAYEVMMQVGAFQVVDHEPRLTATVGEIDHFLAHLERAAIDSGFLNPDIPKKFMTRMRRLFTRARMEPEEVAILRGLLSSFQDPKSPLK